MSYYEFYQKPLHALSMDVRYSENINIQNSDDDLLDLTNQNGLEIESMVIEILSNIDVLSSNISTESYKVVAHLKSKLDNYVGLALYVPTIRSVVIVHYNTCEKKYVLNEFWKISNDSFHKHLISVAATFVQKVKEFIEVELDLKINIIITGEHIGGWLAQITSLTYRHLLIKDNVFELGPAPKNLPICLVFDPPGALKFIRQLKECYKINSCGCRATVYLTNLNLINTLGYHCGEIYKLVKCPRGKTSKFEHPFNNQIELNSSSADINDIHRWFKHENSTFQQVYSWPSVSFFDYEDFDYIHYLQEEFLNDDCHDNTFGLNGRHKYYELNHINTKEVNSRIPQNFFVRLNNTKVYPLTSFINMERFNTYLSSSDTLQRKLRQIEDSKEEFVLNLNPRGINLHYRIYNHPYSAESIEHLWVNLFGGDTTFRIQECYYDPRDAEKSSVIVLLSERKDTAIILTGIKTLLKESFITDDSIIDWKFFKKILLHTDSLYPSNIHNAEEKFEDLCGRFSVEGQKLCWFHIGYRMCFLKAIYDGSNRFENIRLDRELNENNLVILSGEPLSGKTYEIKKLIYETNLWVVYFRIIEFNEDDYIKMDRAVKQYNKNKNSDCIIHFVMRFIVYAENDEEIVSFILKQRLYEQDGIRMRIVFCFDGMHLIPTSIGKTKPREIFKRFLMHLINITNGKILLTTSFEDEYQSMLYKDLSLGKETKLRKISMIKSEQKSIEDVIKMESVVVSAKNAHLSEENYLDSISTKVRNLLTKFNLNNYFFMEEASLQFLNDSETSINNSEEFYTLLINRNIKLFIEHTYNFQLIKNELFEWLDYNIKEHTFNKLIKRKNVISNQSRSGFQTEPIRKFWNRNSDSMIELLSAEHFYGIINIDASTEDEENNFWKDVMIKKEYDVIRRFLDQVAVRKLEYKKEINESILSEEIKFNGSDESTVNILENLLKENRMNLIKFYIKLFANKDAFIIAVREQNEELLVALMDINPSLIISSRSTNGNSPLHEVVLTKSPRSDIVSILIEKGKEMEKDILSVENNEGDTPLHLAIKKNNFELIKIMTEQQTNLERINNLSFTPFLCAVSFANNTEIVQHLIDKKCDIKAKASGFGAIHYAAARENDEFVKLLLKEQKTLINDLTFDGKFTPLHIAAAKDALETVRHLVEEGSDIDGRDKKDRTPLHLAASTGRLHVVKYLVEKGCKVNLQCSYGYTPIHLATKNGHITVVKFLIGRNDIDLYLLNKKGFTPLHSAVNNVQSKYQLKYLEIVGLFLDCEKYDINEPNGLNETVLSFRIKQKLDGMKIYDESLIEKINIGIPAREGFTSFHFAAFHGNIEMIKKLNKKISAKDDERNINITSKEGYTPLYVSVAVRSDKEVKKLLGMKVKTTITDKNGVSPFHLACYMGKYCIVDILPHKINKKTKNGSTALHLAVNSGHIDIVTKLILEHKADISQQDDNGFTPLHVAAYYDRVDIINLLLNQLESPNKIKFVNCKSKLGSTALNLAARMGKYKTVMKLLDHGADIEIADNKGNNPFHSATFTGHIDIVDHILKNVKSESNLKAEKALFLAVKQNEWEIVKKILDYTERERIPLDHNYEFDYTPIHVAVAEKNISKYPKRSISEFENLLDKCIRLIDIQDKNGRTALYVAASAGNKDAVDVLIKKGADITKAQNKGWTPIHVAAYKGHFQVVRTLIKSNENASYLSSVYSDLPIHLAAWNGESESIKYLLERKINRVAVNKLQISPLDLAVSQGHAHKKKCIDSDCHKCKLYRDFTINGYSTSYLSGPANKMEYEAVSRGDIKTVEYLHTQLEADFDSSIPNKKIKVMHAAKHPIIIKYLSSRGCDINQVTADTLQTPLYRAVVDNNFATVKALVELGADINKGDNNGWGSLHAAVYKNLAHIVEYLCEKPQCDINRGNESYNITPLYIGAQYNCLKAVDELIKKKADPTIADKNGYTPLKVVICQKDPRYAEMLEKIKKYTENWNGTVV